MTRIATRIYADPPPRKVRTIDLYREADGTITASGGDVGSGPREAFGGGDFEFWVTIAPDQVAALCHALLRDKLQGRADAVDLLRDYCKAEGIEHTYDTWR